MTHLFPMAPYPLQSETSCEVTKPYPYNAAGVDWPEGHRWSRIQDEVDCPDCVASAKKNGSWKTRRP